jgi:ATP-dependent helicase/nuclease subunit A
MMELTPAQRTAITEHQKNLMVMAGAGSGKTYVLVQRYMALLDTNRDWPLNALVAITFTKKAAQEMRDRVRQALETRLAAAADAAERDCWAGRITSMESARIDTIHALCASILRANAAVAGVDPQFEVLDEIQARVLLDDTLDDLMVALAGEDNPAVVLFAEYGIQTVRSALINLIGERIPDVPDNLLECWQSYWQEDAAREIEWLLQHPACAEALAWQPRYGWPTEEDKLTRLWSECLDSLSRLQSVVDFETAWDALGSIARISRTGVQPNKRWNSPDDYHGTNQRLMLLIQAAGAAVNRVGLRPGELDTRAAELLPLWVALLRHAQGTYAAAKERRSPSALDFDDLERLTRDLLVEHPDVCARYRDAEFRHMLIDEFQDTNAAQWEIANALADVRRPGSLFVVGDEKQSIYQFRGADVSVFGQVRAQILEADGKSVALARSFRTHQRLIDCFNSLFAALLRKDPSSPAAGYEVELGEPMDAARGDCPQDVPPLELLLLNKDLSTDDDDSKAAFCRRWEAYEIAGRLHQLVREGRLIYDKDAEKHRPMNYGDIAILFQATTSIILYEDVFKAVGLPFVTFAGRGYYNRQEVWDLLNLLTALHNPADNLALATALRSPLFSLSDDALLALRLRRDEQDKRVPLWDALAALDGVPADEHDQVQFARAALLDLRALAGRVTISELLREALERTGYLATLTSLPDGARRRGNVEKLLEKARTTGYTTLGTFEQYLRDMSDREAREGEALVDVKDAVRLMTVHGSKGLEFPVVVLIDCSWTKNTNATPAALLDQRYGLACKVYNPASDKIEKPYIYRAAERLNQLRGAAERKRLLYVAATRAQDYLILSGQVSPGTKKPWKTDGWLSLLLDGFGLADYPFEPGTHLLPTAWGGLPVTMPERPPAEEALVGGTPSTVSAWEHEAVARGELLPGDAVRPPLVGRVPRERTSAARHLTATQIADLGSAAYQDYFGERFRRSVLHDAPAHIPMVSSRDPLVSSRMIGDMVHKVLGWWQPPFDETNLDDILRSYAWDLGVVDDGWIGYAVQEARRLLRRAEHSDVLAWLNQSPEVYRELPFIYRTDRRVIHGVLDVLFRRPDGTWAVVDYKTSYIERGVSLAEHARRFHLQVGVYAAAVRQQLDGLTPDAYIHYIREGETVQIPAVEWERALTGLENTIGNLLSDDEDT